jgi:hypothetical protein
MEHPGDAEHFKASSPRASATLDREVLAWQNLTSQNVS